MLESAILDVAIGLVFLYVLLSLTCSAINEILAHLTNLRARTLEQGLKKLIGDPAMLEKFYHHPLIKSLGARPSHIPPATFALALLDIAKSLAKPADEAAPESDPPAAPSHENAALDFSAVRAAVLTLPATDLRKTLLSFLDTAGRDLDKARRNLAAWFDEGMIQVTNWYRKRVHLILLVAALVLTVALNADTVRLATTLWADSAVREGLVAVATEFAKQAETPEEALAEVQERLEGLQFPLGWQGALLQPPDLAWKWVSRCVGFLLTTFAVSLGAPFWFDFLRRLVGLRPGSRPEP